MARAGEGLRAAPNGERPTFFFDFSSPYAYLAAERVNAVFAAAGAEIPEWQPISFGFVLQASGRVPWSLRAGREEGMREVEERAAERGLPPVRWPAFWRDAESLRRGYSLVPIRAATFAKQSGRAVAFSLAAFRQAFAAGRDLGKLDTTLLAAAACELHPRAVTKGIETRAVREGLREATERAIAMGIEGVPTVAVGGELYWGDDRLEDAAAAAAP